MQKDSNTAMVKEVYKEYGDEPDFVTISNDCSKEINASRLYYLKIITKEQYEEFKTISKDPNANKEGYFQCWECGCWEKISKRQQDGTCGC